MGVLMPHSIYAILQHFYILKNINCSLDFLIAILQNSSYQYLLKNFHILSDIMTPLIMYIKSSFDN